MPTGSSDWQVVEGPIEAVPSRTEAASWIWVLKDPTTSEVREIQVTVTWRGFESVHEIPSEVTREAFKTCGRTGIAWFGSKFQWASELIYHSQTLRGPFGSTNDEFTRLPQP